MTKPALIFAFALFALAAPAMASAAQLSVEPSQATLKAGEEMTVVLKISSAGSINTVGTALLIPSGLAFVRAEKGRVLTEWIDEPMPDKAGTSLPFSGIIAGGWQGSGTLLQVTFVAKRAGTYALAYDPAQTEVYQNDGRGTRAPVAFGGFLSSLPPTFLGWAALAVLFALLLRLMLKRYTIRLV